MKNKLYILFFFLCFLQTQQLVYSQTHPVQAVPTVVSPYSSKLSDYSNAMANPDRADLTSFSRLKPRVQSVR